MLFSVLGVSWHLSNFLNISFGNQPKQKITISESENKKERTTSKCLEINRDVPLEIPIPKIVDMMGVSKKHLLKKELTWHIFQKDMC